MDVRKNRWIHAIKTEERVRLNWYLKNRDQLQPLSDDPPRYKVDPKKIEEIIANRKDIYAEAKMFPRKIVNDPDNQPVEKIPDMMKPVPPEVTSLIYKSRNKGRITYLKERVKSLPEERYRIPICTSYEYGWKMFECAKTMGGTKVGKSAIIRETFYRRRTGIERDPDWYTVPQRTSPTICNCN